MDGYFKLIIVFLYAFILTTACNGAPPVPPGGAGGGPYPMTHAETILVPTIKLAPGEEKTFACYSWIADHDLLIRGIEFLGYESGLPHHMTLFEALEDGPLGLYDCPEIVKGSWVAKFANGTTPQPLTVPGDAIMKIRAGARVLISIHAINTTFETVELDAGVMFTIDDAPVAGDLLPMGGLGFDRTKIDVPAQALDFEIVYGGVVQFDEPARVALFFPHMHPGGKFIGVYKVVDENGVEVDEPLFEMAWSYDDQVMVVPDEPVWINSGDRLKVRCVYDNPGQERHYGPLSTDAMCSVFAEMIPLGGLCAVIDAAGTGEGLFLCLSP